jgi:hypothetical protein
MNSRVKFQILEGNFMFWGKTGEVAEEGDSSCCKLLNLYEAGRMFILN